MMMKIQRRQALALAFSRFPAAPTTAGVVQTRIAVQDDTWTDAARQRDVPVRVRWPVGSMVVPAGGWPVVLFSHGLGGTRAGGAAWGDAWAEAGFVTVHLQHSGSDFDALRSSGARFIDQSALRRIGSGQQLLARLEDVRFVLDELGRRQAGRLGRWADVRTQAVGMSGHSFGAHTTLGMAGQRYPGFDGITEPRLAAFIAMSPSLPAGGNATRAFERIGRPALCLTGTRDSDVAATGATPERRRSVFTALPAGQKFQLVLEDADHMTFSGETGRSVEIIPRIPATRELQGQHHAIVGTITVDWWRAQLMNDATARKRLISPPGLAGGDVWQAG